MKAVWTILYKTFITQFYGQHAGMFLFALFLLFGMVDARNIVFYHASIMQTIISLPAFLYLVLLLWLLYIVKCMAFCITAIQAADGGFMFQLRALPAVVQYSWYAFISTILYLPVLLYAVVLAVYANTLHSSVSWLVAGWQLLMIGLATFSIFISINKTSPSPISQLGAIIKKIFTVNTSYPFFMLCFILNEKKQAWAIAKIFSLLMLAMLLVRNQDSFDTDLFAIFYPLTILANAYLVFYCVQFNEMYLPFIRNLPLHWIKIVLVYAFTWFVILLPEIVFMCINSHQNLPLFQIAMEALTAVLMLFLFTGIALGCGLHIERYTLFVFVLYIMLLILQKSIGHLGTVAALAVLSTMVFKAHYHSFDKDVK